MQLLNDISHKNDGFSGEYADWGEWNDYYKQFICRCAESTLGRGFKVFGVQNFGEFFEI